MTGDKRNLLCLTGIDVAVIPLNDGRDWDPACAGVAIIELDL